MHALDTLPSWGANRADLDYFLFTTTGCAKVANQYLHTHSLHNSNLFVVDQVRGAGFNTWLALRVKEALFKGNPNYFGLHQCTNRRKQWHATKGWIVGMGVTQLPRQTHALNFGKVGCHSSVPRTGQGSCCWITSAAACMP